ncbi:hypothetical protein A8C56_19885 [Niabella ginsenosidivorans]|uniref:Uncharacterized protein n=1 Tax=Niabella ginsenosidivorans TaxID=1176587 RepID=A0A1A9I5I1_9BACT|nr:hypothetical protein A8C56_19885 [Niabella ginsenosidivorans]
MYLISLLSSVVFYSIDARQRFIVYLMIYAFCYALFHAGAKIRLKEKVMIGLYKQQLPEN